MLVAVQHPDPCSENTGSRLHHLLNCSIRTPLLLRDAVGHQKDVCCDRDGARKAVQEVCRDIEPKRRGERHHEQRDAEQKLPGHKERPPTPEACPSTVAPFPEQWAYKGASVCHRHACAVGCGLVCVPNECLDLHCDDEIPYAVPHDRLGRPEATNQAHPPAGQQAGLSI